MNSGRYWSTLIALHSSTISVGNAWADSHSDASGAGTDFVDFWAAARLLITGGNPFSPSEVLALQHSVGFLDSKPLLLWNPPWTLSFILPFGALDFQVSHFLWLLVHAFFILLSAQVLWRTYNPNSQKSYSPWWAALALVPTWFVLILGQLSPLVLLGIAAFLHFERKEHFFLAGVATILLSTKPQLVYLFWIALFLSILHTRRWLLALGAALGGVTVATIPLLIRRSIYSDFLEMYRNPGRTTPFELPAPSLGSWLTLSLSEPSVLVQFFPTFLGSVWFLWYWRRHKFYWNWSEQMPILLLASLTMCAYAWTYDYVVLLPAVIHGFVLVKSRTAHPPQDPAVMAFLAVNVLYLIMKFVVVSDYYYVWLAPSYLMIYLGAKLPVRKTNLQAA